MMDGGGLAFYIKQSTILPQEYAPWALGIQKNICTSKYFHLCLVEQDIGTLHSSHLRSADARPTRGSFGMDGDADRLCRDIDSPEYVQIVVERHVSGVDGSVEVYRGRNSGLGGDGYGGD